MKQSILILAVLFGLHTTANAETNTLLTYLNLDLEKIIVEDRVFNQEYSLDFNEELSVASINVVELEEEVDLGFDPTAYLPADFNALEGKNDIDWSTLEVIELEEEVDLGFDPTAYLPEGFNALEGKNDLDWSTIEIIELEEEVDLGFDPKDYLPKGFDPYKGMVCAEKYASVDY